MLVTLCWRSWVINVLVLVLDLSSQAFNVITVLKCSCVDVDVFESLEAECFPIDTLIGGPSICVDDGSRVNMSFQNAFNSFGFPIVDKIEHNVALRYFLDHTIHPTLPCNFEFSIVFPFTSRRQEPPLCGHNVSSIWMLPDSQILVFLLYSKRRVDNDDWHKSLKFCECRICVQTLSLGRRLTQQHFFPEQSHQTSRMQVV